MAEAHSLGELGVRMDAVTESVQTLTAEFRAFRGEMRDTYVSKELYDAHREKDVREVELLSDRLASQADRLALQENNRRSTWQTVWTIGVPSLISGLALFFSVH